jgi:PIN domain nuclease of toxin-antitoxin system
MKLLLDTHCWLWAMHSPEKLNIKVRKLLENPETELYLSAASVWEASIKQALGKLKIPEPLEIYFSTRMREERILELPVLIRHAAKVGELPHHHRDPFDRILIAQAQCENLPIVTADSIFSRYEVKAMWAN